MGNDILLSVDLRVHDGELQSFREAIRRQVAFVETTEPGVRFYKFWLDETTGLARSVHIYADLDALKIHTEIAAPWFMEVLSHATLVKIELLGDVTREQLAGIGVVQAPEIFRELSGFARF